MAANRVARAARMLVGCLVLGVAAGFAIALLRPRAASDYARAGRQPHPALDEHVRAGVG